MIERLLAQTSRPVSNTSPPDAPWQAAFESLRETYNHTPPLGWLTLFGAVVGGLVIGHIVRMVLGSLAAREHKAGREIRGTGFDAAAAPASLALITVGLAVGLSGVSMGDEVRWFAGRALLLMAITAFGWFGFNFIETLDLFIRRYALRSGGLSTQIAPLVRKSLRLFLVVVLVLFTAESVFDRDISAWLAGLGIAGLAVTLAAQDSIKNLFGSMTVLFDKPFKIGDRIVFDGHEGTVIDIGFRSTKVRTLAGPIVTIPNARIVDGSVLNVSRRQNVGRTIDVGLTYDTPAEQVRQAIEAIRGVLAEPAIAAGLDIDANPPRVHFESLGMTSLNIRIWYWYKDAADAWGYQRHAEAVNLRLLEVLEESGIGLASATQPRLPIRPPKTPAGPPPTA